MALRFMESYSPSPEFIPTTTLKRKFRLIALSRDFGTIVARRVTQLVVLLACTLSNFCRAHGQATIDFNHEIRPILSSACFKCHGPDKETRQAELRLDVRNESLDWSTVVRRISSNDPDEVMPPPDSGLLLAPAERESLKQWIEAGAPYAAHWAFVPPRKASPPVVKQTDWPRGAIDHFILARLEQEGLRPSVEANRSTIIRRLSFDLTGLPPTPEEVAEFQADDSANAVESLVDRLLTSPHFGERMAQVWLDLARYADSDGYHDDTTRSMWRYRDYVIESFNHNKPFDQFTVEQLAGDMLPNATVEQKIGSAFHRNGPTSSEGGADSKEYAVRYAVDRVNTTARTWLGVTLECAECHDHKYDPITTREFYQMFAFFNQVPEDPLQRALQVPPIVAAPTREQEAQLAALTDIVKRLETEAEVAGGDPSSEEALKPELEAAKKRLDEFAGSIPKLRVMADVPARRPTFVLVRGDYRSLGEEVQPGVPAALGTLPTDMKADRLALARWVTDRNNPLTARVMVNRLWQMVFGTGLVKTVGEFGSQGDRPSHPELLDSLAVEFMESGWDVKHLLRLIVASATYRQSSHVSPELLERDPENRLLARGPRFRLPAEFIRDNALAISGLLDRDRPPGGPSVKPYQPGDLWREFSYGDSPDKSYVRDKGSELYRRGIYTFWKRSVLHPGLAIFDAPNREVCTAQRSRTNTPLQAFLLLNDETYIEAARVFAERVMKSHPAFDERLRFAFLLAVARPPSEQESKLLQDLFEDVLSEFQGDVAAANALLAIGDAPRAADLRPEEHAAWTCVANAILNFDQTLTKD